MRVVQDSEDEDDLEIEVIEDAPRDEASREHEQRGTGSTESLKRNIEDAHRAQFQSPRDASLNPQDAPHSVALANKRRKTSLDPSTTDSFQMGSTKRDTTTNSESMNHTFSLPNTEQISEESRAQPTLPSPDKPWDLQGSMREEWQYHEPGMFVEASSTVPNATATQQQLLREVLAPDFLGVEATVDVPYQPPKSSFPWSDYLKSSSTRDPQDESRITSHSQQRPSENSPNLASLNDPSNTTNLENSPTLVPTSRESGSQQKSNALPQEVTGIDFHFKETTALPMSPTRETRSTVRMDGSITPSRLERHDIPTHIDPVQTRKSPRQQRKSQTESISMPNDAKTQAKSISISEPLEESILVEIPKEQYVPRPSRSRSTKLSLDAPIDYSVRLEKATLRTRRIRTSNAMENGSATTTPEKVRQICDMGFTPTTTQRALKRHHGDMVASLDWLIASHAADEDELAPPRSSKSKKKDKGDRPEKPMHSVDEENSHVSDIPDPEEGDAVPTNDIEPGSNDPASDEPAAALSSKSPKVKVVIPSKSRGQTSPRKPDAEQQTSSISVQSDDLETPNRKPKRRKTAAEQPETLADAPSDSPIVVAAPAKEKRKRGRPRKEEKAKPAEEKKPEDMLTHQEEDGTALQEIQPNVQMASEELEISGKQSNQATTEQMSTVEDADEPPDKRLLNITDSGKPAKQSTEESSASPDPIPRKPLETSGNTSSPHTKGKITYRVGLSKRARIAPLLRVVKK
ncbi:hypothetical protein DM02DRAFT_724725 [Periconia macrospinosa]|uniref:UBA domain-containing protein n=1 Tax=Periconia macrospinosa TaxID=97972 RepID=A0A2V1E643_9PLEO|nr:hypothetical protein DM02DRAFT_724725 [Periconia macrospinosa]